MKYLWLCCYWNESKECFTDVHYWGNNPDDVLNAIEREFFKQDNVEGLIVNSDGKVQETNMSWGNDKLKLLKIFKFDQYDEQGLMQKRMTWREEFGE